MIWGFHADYCETTFCMSGSLRFERCNGKFMIFNKFLIEQEILEIHLYSLSKSTRNEHLKESCKPCCVVRDQSGIRLCVLRWWGDGKVFSRGSSRNSLALISRICFARERKTPKQFAPNGNPFSWGCRSPPLRGNISPLNVRVLYRSTAWDSFMATRERKHERARF